MSELVYLLLSILGLGIVDGIELLIIRMMLEKQSKQLKKRIIKIAKKESLAEIKKIFATARRKIKKDLKTEIDAFRSQINLEDLYKQLSTKILRSINMKLNRISQPEVDVLKELQQVAKQEGATPEALLSKILPDWEVVEDVKLGDILQEYGPLIRKYLANYRKKPKNTNITDGITIR